MEKELLTKEIKSLLKNKKYVVCIIIALIAAYGFAITHFSLGIDDFGVSHYMSLSPERVGNMLQQGRLMHLIFYYILGLADVIPFLNNFIAVLLLGISAVILTSVIQIQTERYFSDGEIILFSILYVSYPIIAFKFIYDIDVVVTMFSYCCVPVAIYEGIRFLSEHTKKSFIFHTIFLMMALGSYESFICLYICETIAIFSFQYLYKNEKVKKIVAQGMYFAGQLVLALIIYYALVKGIQFITNNPQYVRATSAEMSLIDLVRMLYTSIADKELFIMKEFTLFVCALIGIMLYYVGVKRKYFLLLLLPALGFFTIFVSIIQGTIYLRTCQSFNFFIGFVSLLVLVLCRNHIKVKKMIVAFGVLVIIWQLKDINLWFFKDWTNYEKNVYAIHRIATDLQAEYNVEEKPVCFVNRDYESYLMTWDNEQREIGESPIVSAIGFLGNSTSPELIQLFKYQGYDFLKEPTKEQVDSAVEIAKQMYGYPTKGYILENEEFIVVNLGKGIDE